MCSYASHTFKDKNYIKRLLQIKRLEHSFLWLKSHQINNGYYTICYLLF